jgi:hypothetical protein
MAATVLSALKPGFDNVTRGTILASGDSERCGASLALAAALLMRYTPSRLAAVLKSALSQLA